MRVRAILLMLTLAVLVAGVTTEPSPASAAAAGVTITESSGSTKVIEGGASDTYFVVLNAQPSGTVTINFGISPVAQVSVSPFALTFTTANWGTFQAVTVTAVDDTVPEATHTVTITHSAVGGGYGGVSIPEVIVKITDDDPSDVTITQSGGSTDVTEGGATDSYTLVLAAEPAGTVTISFGITPEVQVVVSPPTVVFTASDWSAARTVTITAVDDAIVEGTHTGTITHSAAGGGYDNVVIPKVVANITDNDTGSVIVAESDGSTAVTEGGATSTYSIVLDSAPSDNVIVSVNADEQLDASPAALTFTPSDWDTAQTVTVTAVDDTAVEGVHVGTIDHSASGVFAGVSTPDVQVVITDNDAVTIAESGGSTDVTEGGSTDTYTVVLDTMPSGTVTVTLAPDSQLSLSHATLTFTTSNWDTAQTVTVTAVDNAVVEGPHRATIEHTVAGGGYDAISIARVVASITDDDGSVIVTESAGSTIVVEGGATDTYTVALGALPSATVSIGFGIAPEFQVSISPAPLTFTPSNWNVPQRVTVTAVADAIVENDHAATITHFAGGGGYEGILAPNVEVKITDEKPGATVTESGGSTGVAEGGAGDSYTVALDARPSGTVTVTLTPDAQLSVSPSTLTFTASDWDSPKTVTVAGIDDDVIENDHTGTIVHSASGGGSDGALIPDVVANIADNDAVVTVMESGGSTDVIEAGKTDAYTVALIAEPTGSVAITIEWEPQVSVSPATLVYTTADWDTPQTVTVSAVDDAFVEGAHTATIAHTIGGGGYDGAPVPSVVAFITDDDATITLTESDGSTHVSEDGATDSYALVLNAEPSGDVTISISTDPQVYVSPSELVFTRSDWDTPQTGTVTAVDDISVEGAHTSTIAHIAAGGSYNGVPVPDVEAAVTDNDAYGVTVTKSGGTVRVTEGQTTDSYTVVLDAEPSGEVTITITPDAQVTVSPDMLTFTTSTWHLEQAVMVAAVDDSVVEGAHRGFIASVPAGGGYDEVLLPDIAVDVADNDASVSIAESAGSTDVTEGRTSDTYSVVLGGKPSGVVSITISPDGQVGASPARLRFTIFDWNMAQTVTVAAVDDLTVEGVHTGTISHVAFGGGYDRAAIRSVKATISDNDWVGISVLESDGSTDVTEGGPSDVFMVVLDAEPPGEVTVAITADPQVAATPESLTFSTSTWNRAQAVVVTAVDDAEFEGAHAAAITNTPSGAGYDGASVTSVVANITDNDASVTVAESGGSTDLVEGGAADTYGVVLDTEPLGTVAVTLTPDSQVNLSRNILTFTTSTWSTKQRVTVAAVDDAEVESAHRATIVHSAAGGGYDGVTIPSIQANIIDDDVVRITASGGTIEVAEGGGTDTYRVALRAEPSGNVTINIIAGSQIAVSPATLTFITANWDRPQTVTVAASEDSLLEGTHEVAIVHSITGGYKGVSVPRVVVSIADNDAGVTITESDGSTDVTEGGAGDAYAVALDTKPLGTVTITLEIDGDNQVGVSPATLTFTTASWSRAKDVAVTAFEDGAAEGEHTVTIAHSASGGGYDNVSISHVSVTIGDKAPAVGESIAADKSVPAQDASSSEAPVATELEGTGPEGASDGGLPIWVLAILSLLGGTAGVVVLLLLAAVGWRVFGFDKR